MKELFSSIEALESRIAPAALSAKFLAGVLNITGDPAAPTISISQSGGEIEVFDGVTTLGVFIGPKSINLNFVGDATVNLSLTGNGLPGLCKIAAHGGSIMNVAAGSHLNGGLVVIGDVNPQQLTLGDSVTIGKSLVLKGGGGQDTINVGNGGTIGGNLTLVSVETGAFNANSVATAIAGSLKINNADDPLSTSITTTDNTGLTIGGGVSYVGGNLNDNLFLSAKITKGVNFVDTAGDNGLGVGFTSVIHGSVKMTGGVGADHFNIQGGTIDGNVTLNLAGGNNNFLYGIGGSVTIGKNVSMTAGSGNDKWQGSGGLLTVGKNVNVNMSGGTNTIAVGVNISGTSLVVTTGSGVDSVGIFGTGTSVAAVIALGAGSDSLDGDLLGSAKSATLNGGAGTDHLFQNSFVADPFIIRSFEDLS